MAYFDHRITNAYTESVNSLIRVMVRLGRGYSFEALRAKLLFSEGAHKKSQKRPAFERRAPVTLPGMGRYIVDFTSLVSTNSYQNQSNNNQERKYYREGIAYQFVRPTTLYVRWSDDLTGIVHEDTVDLHSVLPKNLERTNLYFIIHGEQLYVYLKLDQPHA